MATLALKKVTVACINALVASSQTHKGGFTDEEIIDLLQLHMTDPLGNPYVEVSKEVAVITA